MTDTLEVAVLLFDPKLPYSFSKTNEIGKEELEAARHLREALSQLDGYNFTYFDDHETLIDALRKAPVDLALNFCDVGYRNDWNLVIHIATLLEVFGIPYTGSDASAMIMASDKPAARALAIGCGVPVPDETYIDLAREPYNLPERYPALIKPCIGGGSWGVSAESVVHDEDQARRYLKGLADKGEILLVVAQEFLTGEEYTVGVLGNAETGLEILPPMAIDYSQLDDELPPIFTYDAKFDPESPYYESLRHHRAEISDAELEEIGTYCERLFARLGARDYARIDFRRDASGQVKFLDANPNPTWYWDSRLAIAASWAGYDYPRLIEKIMQSAWQRNLAERAKTS
jgi:D-alanine-D-alanine ligase